MCNIVQFEWELEKYHIKLTCSVTTIFCDFFVVLCTGIQYKFVLFVTVEVTMIPHDVKNPLGGVNGEYLLLSLVPPQTNPKYVITRKEITETIYSTVKTFCLPGYENMRIHSYNEPHPLYNVVCCVIHGNDVESFDIPHNFLNFEIVV